VNYTSANRSCVAPCNVHYTAANCWYGAPCNVHYTAANCWYGAPCNVHYTRVNSCCRMSTTAVEWHAMYTNCNFFHLMHSIWTTWTMLNPLMPNDHYSGRTAPLTSKRSILYIYSTNMGTAYFKHSIYSPFFSLQNAVFHNSNVFGSCIIHILYTSVLKLKK
jgi:hypothetical protein